MSKRTREPLLDDWVDGKPDAWDYEAVLRENRVVVECDTEGEWSLGWENGGIYIGQTITTTIARKAAAMFVSLWLRGVSASFADKLMDGYIVFLERQESTTLGILAGVYQGVLTGQLHFRFTREGLLTNETWSNCVEDKIIDALCLQAGDQVTITIQKVEH